MQVYKTRTGREYFVIGGVVYMIGIYTGEMHESAIETEDFPEAITDGVLKFSRLMSPAEYVMRADEAKQLSSTNC